MCGIAGFINLDGAPATAETAQAMAARLAHRGPDGEGLWAEAAVALAHRRLAIIDLSSASAQPMHSSDGRHVLVYNGELYNFRELRQELAMAGVNFSSTGDTEVVLAALKHWGEEALLRFNGMFALALWDRVERRLLLARDRYGIKPLYWSQSAKTLMFASEIKAFMAHPDFRSRLDQGGLQEYFTFQNMFSDRTLFADVRLLPAGCSMTLSPGSACSAPRRYWDFDFTQASHQDSEHELVEELDRLFCQAVDRQRVAHVGVGAYLSGGLDTGAITAHAAKLLDEMPSFTVGFDLRSASGIECGFDERESAEHMSYLFRTEHYQMVLKAGDMERSLPSIVNHLEDPRVGQCYPNYFAAKLASRFVKVVLSGTGGDELFGGYPWRYYRARAAYDFESFVDSYYAYWQRMIPADDARDFFSVGSDMRVNTRDIFRSVFTTHASRFERPEDTINHSLYFEAKTFLHGLLMVEDKLSMAHGLETRLPFLDNDLVDFALRLPVSMKVAHFGDVLRINENEPRKTERYFQQTRDGKLLLRKALARHVPPEVSGRGKQGFSGPDASWFRGDSIDFVRRRLMEGDSPIYAYLRRETVRRLVADHLEGRENRRLLIWSLLTFDQWLRAFLGGTP